MKLDSDRVATLAAELAREPEGATRRTRYMRYAKHPRGDWIEIASGPDRWTSHELACLIEAERHQQ